MDDDFDLFPKRENLDPFSFGTQEKKTEKEKGIDDLFGQEEPPGGLPDLPLGGPETGGPAEPDRVVPPPASPPASPTVAPPDPIDLSQKELPPLEPKGPDLEEKTFDEPTPEVEPASKAVERKTKKSPSPFVVVGGALVIILALLYGALTFLKRDRPPAPQVIPPAVSVLVGPEVSEPAPAPEPAPEPEPARDPETTVPQPSAEGEQTAQVPAGATKTSGSELEAAPSAGQQPAETPPAAPPSSAPPASTAGVSPKATGGYSVQVGALVLESSVRELEKRVASLGYETFQKMGSTTAKMNMLTVGPFPSMEEARKALSRLRESGIDSNLVQRSGGGAVINAGSYLLEENASRIRNRIESMGYQVEMGKKAVNLPMTFVRVGHFSQIDEANLTRDELRAKGLDAIVVKLQ